MLKICAWCRKEMSMPGLPDPGIDPSLVSHGICPDCLRSAMSFRSTSMKQFLDEFEAPVFLVDEQGRVLSANGKGCAMLGKDLSKIVGEPGGNAFDCVHAKKPGGCGQTIHCKTCTIRNAVMQTIETGQACKKIPAYPDLNHVTGENRICFLISTERLGAAVILKIDDVFEDA